MIAVIQKVAVCWVVTNNPASVAPDLFDCFTRHEVTYCRVNRNEISL
jgi:hypothetical protein